MKAFRYSLISLVISVLVAGCSTWEVPVAVAEQLPPIFPDYSGVTVPSNIAPLNFMVEGADKIQAEFIIDGCTGLDVTGKEGVLDIPLKKWRKLLKEARNNEIEVVVTVWDADFPDGIRYSPFRMAVAADEIDGWVAYRLIEPGYVGWRQLGLYQRNLTSFKEKAIVTNRESSTTCLNCHHVPSYSPESMMFHARGKNGGTIIYHDGMLKKIDFKSIGPKRNPTYPAWHPGGRYIAFSSNTTNQLFFGEGKQPIEVYDTASDLMVYDTETGEVMTDPRFMTEGELETFPSWSPDGKYLYFASYEAEELPVKFSLNKHYDILRVAFDQQTCTFGEKVDTLYNSRERGGSASYPRISPDGRYMLYTCADYGTFPIWHNEADLRMTDLTTGEDVDVSIWNDADEADSYHSWSSDGRWVLFGSRRLDGRYTRLYIAYMDPSGVPHKPFLLPQEDPRQNSWRLKSYNVPEFITGEIDLPADASDLFYSEE